MLLYENSPADDTADAFRPANVCTNNFPTRANEHSRTLNEMWYGVRLEMSKRLCRGPFGCLVYFHIHKDKRVKYGDRARPAVFHGLDENTGTFFVKDWMSGRKGYTHSVEFVPNVMPHRQRPAFLMQYERMMGRPSAMELMDGLIPSAAANRPMREYAPSKLGLQSLANLTCESDIVHGGFGQRSMDGLRVMMAQAEEADPTTMEEMNKSNNKDEWIVGLRLELTKLESGYKAWVLIPPNELEPGVRIFKLRLVFKTKHDAPVAGESKGRVKERKVRVTIAAMTRLLTQGIDYDEKHSSTVRWHSIRLLVAFAVQHGLKIKLKDMESFYLCGTLDPGNRMIAMRQVKGFETPGKEDWLCQVLKGLYGLPQAGNIAQKKLSVTLTDDAADDNGFDRLSADDCVYRRRGKKLGDDGYVALGSHVDDLTCIGDDNGYETLDNALGKQFKIKSEDDPAMITGVQLMRTANWAKLHMAGYIEGLLEKTGMQDCKPQAIPLDPGIPKGTLPQQGAAPADGFDVVQLFQCILGMLLWPAVRVRPDILFAVGFLGRFASNAGNTQIDWAKGVIRYLAGTKD